MTLSELVIKYRTEHDLSQRQFAIKCGVSNGYIAMLEKNINPKTGQPLIPQIPSLAKIATGMSMSLDELFTACDDMLVSLSTDADSIRTAEDSLTDDEEQLLSAYRDLNELGREKALDYLSDLRVNPKYQIGDSAARVV